MKTETVLFRCYISNEYNKVGQKIGQREYNSLPSWAKEDYRLFKD